MKCIIFDFDGVILDSVNVKTEAFGLMYHKYGNSIKQKVINYHIENGGISRYKKIKHFHTEFLGQNLDMTSLESLANKFSQLVFEKVCNSKFMPGALELLNQCRYKYLNFICTGTPQEEIMKIVFKKKLNNFFHGIYGSPKSKENIINDIIKSYNLKKNEVLFLGDAMTDYLAAKKTGISFVGVKNDHTSFPANTKLVENLMDIFTIKSL